MDTRKQELTIESVYFFFLLFLKKLTHGGRNLEFNQKFP